MTDPGAEMLPVMLDRVYYKEKPRGGEWGRLTNSMKNAGQEFVSKRDFCEHLRRGGSWIGGHFSDGLTNLEVLRLIALDFDSPDRLPPLAALDRCERLDVWPMVLYFTLSATPANPRYRLIFDCGEDVTDVKEAREIIAALLARFPEADKACRDPARRWLGSCGEVWQIWRFVYG